MYRYFPSVFTISASSTPCTWIFVSEKSLELVLEASAASAVAAILNVLVQGVDEADIVKTDGDYIYYITNGNLAIVKAYPADKAELVHTIEFNSFNPNELFIQDDKLLVFGTNYQSYVIQEQNAQIYPRIPSFNTVELRLYDISDKEDPELLRKVNFEGSYLTSRKIDDYVYFVVNTYPRYYETQPLCKDFVPKYAETTGEPTEEDYKPIASCTQIGYVPEIQPQSFFTIASISMENKNEEIEKQVIVGSGQDVYASLQNMYVVQTTYPIYNALGKPAEDFTEKTIISKFSLDDGEIEFTNSGEVPGHILNQFSMDEHKDNFRIATTTGNLWGIEESVSKNNVYVLDEDLKVIGKLEDLAPGEKIYSARFMGDRGYLVTFKKVDPLFVIDLSNPKNPEVLGKLKIPGYSDYLHPYDENHIIGIGKDAVEAAEELKEQRNLDFAWYQGLKMAIFDVSDVENPVEMYKVVIGDRGTDSPVLHNHKAFLFDKEKELLVIPIQLAEFPEGYEPETAWEYGDYTFQGAYVYNINLDDGFTLKGRITHQTEEDLNKLGYYYYGYGNSVERSLYIGNVLYTFSNNFLRLNDLDDLDELAKIEFKEEDRYQPLYEVV